MLVTFVLPKVRPVLPELVMANWLRLVPAPLRGHFPSRRKLLAREKALLSSSAKGQTGTEHFPTCRRDLFLQYLASPKQFIRQG
jgi:hypothetical protein